MTINQNFIIVTSYSFAKLLNKAVIVHINGHLVNIT